MNNIENNQSTSIISLAAAGESQAWRVMKISRWRGGTQYGVAAAAPQPANENMKIKNDIGRSALAWASKSQHINIIVIMAKAISVSMKKLANNINIGSEKRWWANDLMGSLLKAKKKKKMAFGQCIIHQAKAAQWQACTAADSVEARLIEISIKAGRKQRNENNDRP